MHTQALHTAVDYYYIPLPPPWAYSTESSKGDDVWKCEVTADGGKCRACMGPGKKILSLRPVPPLQFIDETASCRMTWCAVIVPFYLRGYNVYQTRSIKRQWISFPLPIRPPPPPPTHHPSPLCASFVTRGNGHLSGDSSKIHQCTEVDQSTIYSMYCHILNRDKKEAPKSASFEQTPPLLCSKSPCMGAPLKRALFFFVIKPIFPLFGEEGAGGKGCAVLKQLSRPCFAHTRKR